MSFRKFLTRWRSCCRSSRMCFPPKLPKKLPPRRAIDHAIELEPGARSPAQAPYRMAPVELAELRKQLDELLETRLVQPSKAPYGSPVLF
ncbi:UNVERIFIED_CONTAM: hypothetical protein Sradi_6150300 [Sesamum radiatum]|uniref:Uncharacterized protein n=1 Tax=Sesamum radiatum TaxID=300843 RepID=A0AAW2KMY0_SESRA